MTDTTTETKDDSAARYLRYLHWDGVARADDWLTTYLGAPRSAYLRDVGACFLRMAARRALEPGCEADGLLVLVASQGAGASRCLRTLGGPWHAEDDAAAPLAPRGELPGAWIVALHGALSLGTNAAAKLDALILPRADRFRVRYTRVTQERPRAFVYVAACNAVPPGLHDERQFWIVPCGRIDDEALARDRDQLWAEAVRGVRDGLPVTPTAVAEMVRSAQWSPK